jgi:hypothetical protein
MHFPQFTQKFNKNKWYSQLHQIPLSSQDKGFYFLSNTPIEIPINILPTSTIHLEIKQRRIVTHNNIVFS